MILSFCIPTFNRCDYLIKNLKILIEQIVQTQKTNLVEICISDNASTDRTEGEVSKIINNNSLLTIKYSKNNKNHGPDRNFVHVMKMATGEYSILWGDDDFLREGGLNRIFYLVNYGKNNGINIMTSSTSIIDSQGKPLFIKNFLRNDIKEYIVDFSNPTESKAYFFLLKDMGGMLSFISDVIYKTSIIYEIPFDDRFLGTHYAFLCFWWGYLAKGNKLYYNSEPFLDETYQYQSAYGFGVDRLMVDYSGYTLVADIALAGGKINRVDFLQAFQGLHPLFSSRIVLLAEQTRYNERILPKLKECGVEDNELKSLYDSVSISYICKNILYKILPESIILYMKKHKKR